MSAPPQSHNEDQPLQNRFASSHALALRIAVNMDNFLPQTNDIDMQVRPLSFNAQTQADEAGRRAENLAQIPVVPLAHFPIAHFNRSRLTHTQPPRPL